MKLFYLAFFICGLTLTGYAQNSQDSTQTTNDDPFKNDPFFSRPVSDFLHEPPQDWVEEKNVRHHVNQINDSGLDYGGGLESGPYNSSILYGVYPSLPMIHYNRVDGLFLGLKKERMQWYNNDWLLGIKGIQPHGFIGYATALKNWQYAIGLEKVFGRRRYMMVGWEYHDATSTDDYWRAGMTETSLTALFAGYDYLDYYNTRGYGVYLNLRSAKYFEGGISYNSDEYTSLDRHTTYSFFGKKSTYRPNPSIDDGKIQSLYIGGSFNPKKLVLLPHFTFKARGLAELGNIDGLDTDFAFNRYMAETQYFISLEPGTMLKIRLRGGSITGNAPVQRRFELGGIGTMRATPYKFYSGNEMLLSNIEMHFGTERQNDSDWIDFDDFTFSVFLDSGWTYDSDKLRNGNDPFTGFSAFDFKDVEHDIGMGIGSSFIRLELAWHLNNLDQKPALWIRLNPTF